MRPEQVDVIGFLNFKKLFKKVKRGLASVAKAVGPAVATLVPGSGPIINAGIKVLKESKKGNKKARAKIAAIKQGAAAGNPRALKSMDALLAANEVIRQVTQPPRTVKPAIKPVARPSGQTDPTGRGVVVSTQTGQRYALIPLGRR